jgi:hypothetical protein
MIALIDNMNYKANIDNESKDIERYEKEQEIIKLELKELKEDDILMNLYDDIKDYCYSNGLSILDRCKFSDFKKLLAPVKVSLFTKRF